jgi:hypothetical protein
MDVEQIDLRELTVALQREFRQVPLLGAMTGRTQLRDATAERLGCSLIEAECLIDTLVLRGYLWLDDAAEVPATWKIKPDAEV